MKKLYKLGILLSAVGILSSCYHPPNIAAQAANEPKNLLIFFI